MLETSKNKVREIEDVVNDCGFNTMEVGYYLTKMHRYLINELFKAVVWFIYFLKKDYEQGYYDGRNEYACKTAAKIWEVFEEDERFYEQQAEQLKDKN